VVSGLYKRESANRHRDRVQQEQGRERSGSRGGAAHARDAPPGDGLPQPAADTAGVEENDRGQEHPDAGDEWPNVPEHDDRERDGNRGNQKNEHRPHTIHNSHLLGQREQMRRSSATSQSDF
jgi:hypothetical protein